jgi:hypothetical protein
LLAANKADKNYDRYVEDVSEFEDFPQLEDFDSDKVSVGMVPATLGIDALDHEELARRTEEAIRGFIFDEEWKAQKESHDSQCEELNKLL